ncbi:MAG: glycosyltransferase family 2 protein [Rikenellaceae bacterium]|nr:glycosyltransferase family 2 protein [Rikenellaceae bacterium]
MRISGFTFIRNAVQFDFPIIECVRSALDLVDEFIVVAGNSEDATDELLARLDSPKVKIIRTTWDTGTYNVAGSIYAQQTDVALRACTGDWCVYVQSDEVLHEDGLPAIRAACEKYLDDPEVEGFVLDYVHLYADYDHYIDAMHFGYPREIRVVRNRSDIHSWKDAQSFRVIPGFDGVSYWKKEGTRKLNCVKIDAKMFHYGWSRDPRCMGKKCSAHVKFYYPDCPDDLFESFFDYGNLNYMPRFEGSHPAVMRERIAGCPWRSLVRFDGPRPDMKKKFSPKYRVVNFIERYMLGGRTIGGFKNYKLLSR